MISLHSRLLLFFPFLLLLHTASSHSTTSASPQRPPLDPHRLHRSPSLPSSSSPQQYLDPTLPPLLPHDPPLLSLPLLRHDFAYTYGVPPATTNFTVPRSPPWSLAVLELSAACAGDQYDRIAAVWVDAVELLRTSTAEPTQSGVFWKVRKDITRYSSLLRSREVNLLTVMLENIVDDVYTGIYHVNVSLHLYAAPPDLPGRAPADLILPISNQNAASGHWFRIRDSGVAHARSVRIPRNAHRAVLEIFVSFHSDDEFWYSNPPNSYIEQNRLPTSRGNSSFRELIVTVDGRFAGSVVPFPVVFTGGINPLFWAPVVAIGAFDLPSYDLDLTPFLGWLLDGKHHEFGLGVFDGISFWLVDANLHLWLDPRRSSVDAGVADYTPGSRRISRLSDFAGLDGTFRVEAMRASRFSGWVSSPLGNLTTSVTREIEFESSVGFANDGNRKEVETNSRTTTEVKVVEEDGVVLRVHVYRESTYPMRFVSETEIVGGENMYRLKTHLVHSLHDVNKVEVDGVGSLSSLVSDEQSGRGWMDVEDHAVVAGSVSTQQSYNFSGDDGCYMRLLGVQDGKVVEDVVSRSCVAAM